MFKQILLALAVTTIAAQAEDVAKPAPAAAPAATAAPAKTYDKYQKVDWEKLTKPQKVAELNRRHAERAKKSEEKWKKMTDDQKIAQYEKRRARALAMREKGKNKIGKSAPAAGTTPAPKTPPVAQPAKQ